MKDAILLLGPTGSGKSPLGDYLETQGLGGRPCRHFDFGHHLRCVAAGADYGLTPDERKVVASVLSEGRLLAPSEFGIACTVLDHFCRHLSGPDMLVILNGLPRHEQQAVGVGRVIAVRHVVALTCDAQTVLRRLALDSGGDRAGRGDDDVTLVQKKLAIYADQTEPLIAYYRTKGVSVSVIDVTVHAQSKDMARGITFPPDATRHKHSADQGH